MTRFFIVYLGVSAAALGAIGTVLIFIWGPPQPNLTTDDALLAEDPVPNAENIRRLRRRHFWMSRLGLFLILVSFLLQLWSSLLSML